MSGPVRVCLSIVEMAVGAKVGMMRQFNAIRLGLNDTGGLKYEDGWKAHIEGACGEFAFSKAFGCFWNGGFKLDRGNTLPDVGEFEVRRGRLHHYELRLNKSTPDERICALITGTTKDGIYLVHGWITGREGKAAAVLKSYTKGRPPQLYVAQALLHDMSTVDPRWFNSARPTVDPDDVDMIEDESFPAHEHTGREGRHASA